VSTFPEKVPQRGKLIAVAGIDGAGKSTLAAALRTTLTNMGHETILAGKQTVDVPSDEDLSQYLDAVNAVVYRRKASVGQACGDHYWLFALAAWHSLQDRHIIRPALQAGIHVILDNSHHKTLARYTLSREMTDGLAAQAFAHLSSPDVILFLRIPSQDALRRKRTFTPLEAGHAGPSAEHFIAYQNKVADDLSRQASQIWESIDVTARAPAAVLDDALTILARRGLLTLDGYPAKAGTGSRRAERTQ
jgi:thymidylate kinase